MRNISIISLGWLGLELYHKLSKDGFNVSGSFHTSPKNVASEFQFDINMTSTHAKLDTADIIILNIPPSKITKDVNLINLISKYFHKKIIFISSTSVYGFQGDVNEYTCPIPHTLNGKRLLGWENFIKDKVPNFQIVRSAGQFGPKRHPGKLLSGRSRISGGNQFINLISQKDLLDIIYMAILSPKNRTINAVNNHHPTKEAFYRDYCQSHQLPEPDFLQEPLNKYKKVNTIYKDYEVTSDLNQGN